MSVAQNSKTILALGDSYTIGESVDPSERFPGQTCELLRSKGIKTIEPEIIATTGWTTTDLMNSLDARPPKNNYSVVTLLIGVNNQYQAKNIGEYRSAFSLLLQRAIGFAANKKKNVYVLSIPDYSVTPFAQKRDTGRISKEIDEFNAVNRKLSLDAGVNYIDITGISREAKHDPSLIANDGLHPSGKQYKRWAEILVQSIVDSQ